MTIEILLAVYGVVLGYISLQDEEQRSQFLFRFGPLEWLVVIIALLVPNIFLFSKVYFSFGLPPIFGSFVLGFDEQLVSYSVFLIGALVLFLMLRMPRLGPGRFGKVVSYFSLLLETRRPERILVVLRVYASGFAAVLNSGKAPQKSVERFHEIMRSSDIARVAYNLDLSSLHPILNSPNFQGGDVLHQWVSEAVQDEDSSFLKGLTSPEVVQAEQFLGLIVSDPKRCEEWALYKPIGDFVLQSIRSQVRLAQDGGRPALLERSTEYLDEVGPIKNFLGAVNAFDEIVRSAVREGVKWHMWLFYLAHFAEESVRLLKFLDDRNQEGESMVEKFLTRLRSQTMEWVKIAKHGSETCPHSKPRDWSLKHENDNIPKSAALCFGRIVGSVYNSSNATVEFKRRTLRDALRLIRDSGLDSEWKVLLLESIRNSGFDFSQDRMSVEDLLGFAEPHIKLDLQALLDQ